MQKEAATVSGEGIASGQSVEQQVETPDTPLAPDEEIQFEAEGEGDGGEAGEGEGEQPGDGEGEGDKAPKKLTAQERIQQLANENRELKDKVSAIEARFEETEKARHQTGQEAPPFIEVDVPAFNSHIASLREKSEELAMEGRHAEAARVDREIYKLLDAYDENEAKKAEWAQEQQRRQQMTTQEQEFLGRFERAADFFREQAGIPEADWEARSILFAELLEKDPLLKEEFRERARTQGTIATIRWANEQAVKAGAKLSQAQREAREEGKEKAVGGTTSSSNVRTVKVSSFQQLLNLGSKAVAKYKETNPKHYNQLLNKHMS